MATKKWADFLYHVNPRRYLQHIQNTEHETYDAQIYSCFHCKLKKKSELFFLFCNPNPNMVLEGIRTSFYVPR